MQRLLCIGSKPHRLINEGCLRLQLPQSAVWRRLYRADLIYLFAKIDYFHP